MLVTNSALDEKSGRVRAKAIPWEGYGRGGLLSDEDVSLVQQATLHKDHDPALEPGVYASLYVRLLSKLSRIDTIQSLLVLLSDFVNDTTVPELIKLDAYDALVKLIDSPDEFIRLKSLVLVATLVSADYKVDEDVIGKLLSRISVILVSFDDPNAQDIAVQCLCGVLGQERVRAFAWTRERGVVAGLLGLIQPLQSAQMLYQLVFCVWLLTFDATIAAEIEAAYRVVAVLLATARDAVKEKVLRIVLATFVNLVTVAPEANLNAMLVAQVLPFVKSLTHRKFVDEDLPNDVEFLVDALQTSFAGLTTFDEYATELASGKLAWTPPHKSDEFWRENAIRLNEKDRINQLVALLDSTDTTTLAVALNDIARYTQNCETGKSHIEKLHAKAKIMALLGHVDSDVKYNALVAVQQLMSHPWE